MVEKFIRQLCFRIVRVRHHDTILKVELPANDLLRFLHNDVRKRVNNHLERLGFVWATVDIKGCKTGGLNSTLEGRPV
jgi:pyridinium-3,5-biscarboxylic acid mononucleotide sulfurtransferase